MSTPPGIQQFSPAPYDMVLAVTQDSLNQALALYLDAIQKQVTLYYGFSHQQQDTVIAVAPDEALFTFTGTLDPCNDDTGQCVPVVQFAPSVGGTAAVNFNLTFWNSSFSSKFDNINIQQQEGVPWTIQFLVGLSTQDVALASLPQATQDTISERVGGLSPGDFSIQQLYLDLTSAEQFAQMPNVEGLSDNTQKMFLGLVMKTYLAGLQQQHGNPVVGYAVTPAPALQPPPTFMPTAIKFSVSNYAPPAGQSPNPGLDTLNYLVMAGNHPLPPETVEDFGFNWVADDTVQGTMAVGHGLVLPVLAGEFGALAQTLSPQVKTDASALTISVEPGAAQAYALHDPPLAGNVVADYSYQTSGTDTAGSYPVVTLSADYAAASSISIAAPDLITVAGTITISASQVESFAGPPVTYVLPDTTYSWSVDLQLQMDLTNKGQLDIVVSKSDFPAKPTVASHGSGWMTQYVDHLDNIRQTIEAQILGTLVSSLKAGLSKATHFVFPGGRAFLFKSPKFNASNDLVSTITYQTP